MDKLEKDIKVTLSLRQKISYYWWIVYFWTPAFLTLLGGIYTRLFIPNHGEIKFLFYFSLACYLVGLIGFIVLKWNLKFEIIEDNLSQLDNYTLILKVIKQLNWKQKNLNVKEIIVSKKGFDISHGQLITIIPKDNKIYFNCVNTDSKFNNKTYKAETYREFKEKVSELTEIKQ